MQKMLKKRFRGERKGSRSTTGDEKLSRSKGSYRGIGRGLKGRAKDKEGYINFAKFETLAKCRETKEEVGGRRDVCVSVVK